MSRGGSFQVLPCLFLDSSEKKKKQTKIFVDVIGDFNPCYMKAKGPCCRINGGAVLWGGGKI